MSAASHSAPAPIQQPPILAPVPAPVRRGPKRPWKWLIVLLVIACGSWFAYNRFQSQSAQQTANGAASIKTVKVGWGTLTRTGRVAGQTAAIDFANIAAPTLRGPESGREMILLTIATPGSWAKKGQLVASIDAQALQDHVDDLGDTIETAQSDIRKREAEQGIEMETLQQTLRVAKSEFDKAKLENSAAEVRTDVERQLLKLTFDETEARYKQLQGDVAFKQASQKAEIRILEYTLLRHTRHRDRHKRDVQLFSVYAPMDGLVVMNQIWRGNEMGQVQAGDRVFPGMGFMKIVNTKKMQVEGTINQSESSEFRIGQPARIKLDAFPGLEFDGKVHSIGALATGGWRQGYYIRTVPIRLEIQGNDPRLIPDLSASADVTLERAGQGTLVPLPAIHSEDGKLTAYVKNGDTFDRRDIQLGLKNDTHAVVLAGLQPGDEVRLN